MRHWDTLNGSKGTENASAWLFNSIANKHADAMDNFPIPAVLFAAGLTYVAAAISSILQLLYWAYRAGLIGGRRD